MDGKEEEVGTARVTTRGITGGTECILYLMLMFDVFLITVMFTAIYF